MRAVGQTEVYFGYAFVTENAYKAYVPNSSKVQTIVDDTNFKKYCEKEYKEKFSSQVKEVKLISIKNIPKIRDRVDYGEEIEELAIPVSKINDLKPLGRLGLNGSCILQALNRDEQKLNPSELIKLSRDGYLEYLMPDSVRYVSGLEESAKVGSEEEVKQYGSPVAQSGGCSLLTSVLVSCALLITTLFLKTCACDPYFS